MKLLLPFIFFTSILFEQQKPMVFYNENGEKNKSSGI